MMSEELVESKAELELELEWDLEWEREREWEWEQEWEREQGWKREVSSIVGVTDRLGTEIESEESESTGDGNTVVWGSNPWGDVSSVGSVAPSWDLVRDLVVGVMDRYRDR